MSEHEDEFGFRANWPIELPAALERQIAYHDCGAVITTVEEVVRDETGGGMTFGEMYAECERRLQGRTWKLEVSAGSFNAVEWKVYVADVEPHFVTGNTPKRALARLDAMMMCEEDPLNVVPDDVGLVHVEET